MLMPSKVKHRKQHKGRGRKTRIASSRISVDFGSYGLKALENGWVGSREIEAARRAMMRLIKKGGKIWIRIFPDKSVTTKGLEVPMGGGKGSVDRYVAPVRRGTVMFELDGLDEVTAREVFRVAGHKLSVQTKFVTKEILF